MSDALCRLWDGSEQGWELQRVEQVEWRLFIQVEGLDDVRAVRTVLPAYRSLPMSALRELGPTVVLEDLGNIEARRLFEALTEAGIEVRLEANDRSRLLAVRAHEVVPLDPHLHSHVVDQMIAAGVPVVDVHVD